MGKIFTPEILRLEAPSHSSVSIDNDDEIHYLT